MSEDLFVWNDKLNTGEEMIDAQHRRLVAMLGDLYTAMKDGAGADLLNDILNGLDDYTRTHFTAEEQLMVASGYDDRQEHMKAHEVFCLKIDSLRKDFQENHQGALSIRVVLFLRDWLQNHIGSVDQQFGAYLKQAKS